MYERDRWFESGFLQRGVCELSVPCGASNFRSICQQPVGPENQSTPGDRRIRFRIGINLGDVVVEEHDIFGDGGMSRRGRRGWLSRVGSGATG